MGLLSRKKTDKSTPNIFEARYLSDDEGYRIIRNQFYVGTTVSEIRTKFQLDPKGPHPKCLAFNGKTLVANDYVPREGEIIELLRPKTLRDDLSQSQFEAIYIPYMMTVEDVSIEKAKELAPKLFEDCKILMLCNLEELHTWIDVRRH